VNEHLLVLQPTKAGLRTVQYKCHIKCHEMFDKNTVHSHNKNVG